jgi:ABC-type hemin transport system substrate-binding protein
LKGEGAKGEGEMNVGWRRGSSFLRPSPFALFLILLACAPRPHPPAHPRRVVTLAPNLTEIVYALGAGNAIVGTDDYSDMPPAAKGKPKVGGVVPSVERILSLHPDVVLVSATNAGPQLTGALARVHLPFEVIHTDRARDVGAAMETIGRLLGLPNAHAARVVLESALSRERRTRAKKPRVLFVAYTQPLYVAGRETFTGDILELTGAENAAAVAGWPQYSVEALIANPPDVVLHPNKSVSAAAVAALFAKSPKKPRIVAVDENVFSRPGPRIVEAAHRLNAILDGARAE